MMLHAEDAPKLDSAYDVLDSLISKSATVALFNMRSYGYGGSSTARRIDEITEEELDRARPFASNVKAVLEAGHFGIPQSPPNGTSA